MADSSQSVLLKAIEFHKKGDFGAAESLYRQVLADDPASADALHLLGLVLFVRGKPEEARDLLQQAVDQKPEMALFHFDLGCVLESGNNLDAAESAFNKAIDRDPSLAQAHFRLGNVLRKKNRMPDAVRCYEEASRLDPNSFDAFNNLGAAYKETGNIDKAEQALRRAAQLRPERAECQNNLGMALSAKGLTEEAIACFSRAIALDASCMSAYLNLGKDLMLMGDLSSAIKVLRRAHEKCPEDATVHSTLLVALAYDPDISPSTLCEEHACWDRIQMRKTTVFRNPSNSRDPDRRLRIGYVSPDFVSHPVAHFLEPVIAHHDHASFRIFCYSDVARPDETTERLKTYADCWRSISLMDTDAFCDMVQSDEIDILVDLAGHLALNRLPAFIRKPAPIQISWIGYPCPTGLRAIDYRLSDSIINPPDEQVVSVETPIRLESGFCCYTPFANAPSVNDLPCGQTNRMTFGSLHNPLRLNAKVLELWAKLMLSVPGSRLLIFRTSLSAWCRKQVIAIMSVMGIAEERIIFRNELLPDGHYLGIYHLVDIALDTFPWSGHTTACEALWMGVPVLTLCGEHPASRMTSSVLTRVELNDFITRSPQEFVAQGTRWANQKSALEEIRVNLRRKMKNSPLCDGKSFTKTLEGAFREVWKKHCMKLPG